MIEALDALFLRLGLGASLGFLAARLTVAAGVLVLAVVGNYVGKFLLRAVVRRVVRHTRTKWDDMIYDRGVLNRFSHIAPALVLYFTAYLIFPEYELVPEMVHRVALAYMIGVTVIALDSLLEAANDIYTSSVVDSGRRPIKGYVQLFKIFSYVVGIILIITALMDVSPVGILSGVGAMSAVILLVFRDSILGFASGLQLSANDMVRLGDWIEMPKYGANGDVIDITLQSIKVQNWDKTVTSIPIYSLVSDSFKNWRGMQESGGRRIKRSIHIDMRSVRFCTTEMLDRFQQFHLIRDYVGRKRDEVAEHNRSLGLDSTDIVSGRALTNLGTFRAYVAAYLRSLPDIHQGLTFLVRHLEPGPKGLPMEIYVFSMRQAWAEYEDIQADIFDHLLAVLPEFGLRVYQEPSGWDLQTVADSLSSGRFQD
jgi:miniconductance mechanosensitive channel